MGVENTWTEEEFIVQPIPDQISLAPPAATIDVTTFEDSTPSSTPLLEDLECLFSPILPPNDVPDEIHSYEVVSESAEPGVSGFNNIGNTCFMNSGLQCLIATAPISAELVRVPFKSEYSLTLAFHKLMRKVWSGRFLTLNPSHFKSALAQLFPQFNDYRQHDCQEFLALLLDALHEQLNSANRKDLAAQCEGKETKIPDPLRRAAGSGDTGLRPGSLSQEADESSKSDNLMIQELAYEVSEKQRSDFQAEEGDFLDQEFLTSAHPVAQEIEVTTTESDVEEDEKMLCQLNNQLPPSGPAPAREELPVVMNSVEGIPSYNDILKEAKTSNLNVLVTEEQPNNETRFDSDKYPRIHNNLRGKKERFNINALQIDNNSNGKRNSSKASAAHPLESNEGLDMKRVKLHSQDEEGLEDKNRRLESERKNQSPQHFIEKNERMECERKESEEGSIRCSQMGSSLLSPYLADISIDKSSEAEADQHWYKHLASNKSVVVDTFQGQFKSTVVCSSCKYISVTYEPFMYLSVPLPNAMQKKLYVTFVGETLKHPTEFLIELNKYDTVSYLRDQILLKVGCEVKGPILIAEGLDHHLSKFLDEQKLIRNLNDDRSLYALEVSTILDATTVEPIEDMKVEDNSTSAACIICLEEKDTNMRHQQDCSYIICDICVTESCKHYGGETFKCPVCRKDVNLFEDLKPLKSQTSTLARMLNIPIVFRVDTAGDGNNNQKQVNLFGHPMVVRAPSRCSAKALKRELASLIHYKEPFRLLLVDGQGLHCSRCIYTKHCRGCELGDGEVRLTSSDSLAVAFSQPIKPLHTTSSVGFLAAQASALTLYDCIQAFSQSEVLDGSNPWFCPQCKQNRCATKTLSVWRYPDYLIVYLKRFVFHNQISTKLEEKVLFPLTGLSLASGSDYDLYACVCHIGGMSSGHYTSYAQHPYNGKWHYFNDSTFSPQTPVEDDYSSAYILFYKKQGLKPPTLKMESGESSRSGC